MSQQTDNDSLVTIQFYTEAVINHPKSEKAQRPIFDDVEQIMFKFAGDNKRVCVFPATETDPNATRDRGYPVSYAEAYSEQYRKFKAQEQQTVSGTPLSEAPFLTEGKRRELRALNIHTVEALAALDGPNLKTLGMGGREFKNQATAYLAKAEGSADVTGMAAQIAKLTENMQMLLAENARLTASQRVGAVAQVSSEDDAGTEKAIEDCSDSELREFIVSQGAKAPPANTGRTRLLEIATELATKDAA